MDKFYKGVFDNGNNDIREVAQYFESAFGIDLGNFYQTYLELRNRKMEPYKIPRCTSGGACQENGRAGWEAKFGLIDSIIVMRPTLEGRGITCKGK